MPSTKISRKALSGEKTLEIFNDIGIDPAFNSLSPPLHSNQTCLAKLLDVMGDRGGDDPQVLAKIADIGTRLRINAVDRTGIAGGDKTHEDPQAVGVGKGLEDVGIFLGVIVSIFRHTSKLNVFGDYVKYFRRGLLGVY